MPIKPEVFFAEKIAETGKNCSFRMSKLHFYLHLVDLV